MCVFVCMCVIMYEREKEGVRRKKIDSLIDMYRERVGERERERESEKERMIVSD